MAENSSQDQASHTQDAVDVNEVTKLESQTELREYENKLDFGRQEKLKT